MPRYKVKVGDNFHYLDQTKESDQAVFATSAEAVDICRQIVDESLLWEYREGETGEELYDRYTSFGSDPFVVALDGAPRVDFSAWTYARERARQMAAPGPDGEKLRQVVLERKNARLRDRR